MLPDIRKIVEFDGVKQFKYFGDVDRYEDIDIFEFYEKHMPFMRSAGPVISKMLGQPAASSAVESLFSHGRFIINDYRTSIAPPRAERVILSCARFKARIVSKSLPYLPSTIVIDDNDITVEMDDDLDNLHAGAGAGDDFVDDDVNDEASGAVNIAAAGNGGGATDLNGGATDLNGDLDDA